MDLLPVFSPVYEYITGISGHNAEFSSNFPDFPGGPTVISAQKTIGAYTESISIGPEMMQNQRTN